MSLAAVESFFDLHARKTTLATAPNYSSCWIPRARRFQKVRRRFIRRSGLIAPSSSLVARRSSL
jgi:hypothetical protein